MTAKRGTNEGDCLDVLVALVEAWERRHYPLGFPEVGTRGLASKQYAQSPVFSASQVFELWLISSTINSGSLKLLGRTACRRENLTISYIDTSALASCIIY